MGDSNSGAFLTGFVLGGLTGAVVALLMTPQSGEETRLQLQEQSVGLRSQFGGLTTDLQERGKGVIEERFQKRGAVTDSGIGEEASETPVDEGDAAT